MTRVGEAIFAVLILTRSGVARAAFFLNDERSLQSQPAVPSAFQRKEFGRNGLQTTRANLHALASLCSVSR